MQLGSRITFFNWVSHQQQIHKWLSLAKKLFQDKESCRHSQKSPGKQKTPLLPKMWEWWLHVTTRHLIIIFSDKNAVVPTTSW